MHNLRLDKILTSIEVQNRIRKQNIDERQVKVKILMVTKK